MDSANEGLTMEIVVISMSLVFMLALALIIFFVVYQRRLLKQENTQREKDLLYQKELLRASVQGQEEERLRIAKDLHDDVGMMLTTAKVYFEQFSNKTDSESRDKLSLKMNQLLGSTIQSIRDISHDLRPVILDKLGLIEAIRALTDTLNECEEIRVEFSHQGSHNYSNEQRINLYRIVQELITNTMKHANAQKITIEIAIIKDQFILCYQDDGIGSDGAQAILKKGIGLKNIESRLSLLSGTIEYQRPSSGFQIEIRVSLTD